jgi:RNA polymerase sigma-70 factor, ECF subfamily
LLAALLREKTSKLVRAGFVNGLPGFISLEADGELPTTALDRGREDRGHLWGAKL